MGRIFKTLVFWTPTSRQRPQSARMQIDSGADRTVLARRPPGAKVIGQGCVNGQTVDIVRIFATIEGTECAALIDATIPQTRGALPSVIGADFLQNANAILDYRGEVIGCPTKKPSKREGFAGVESEHLGILRFTSGACKPKRKTKLKIKRKTKVK